MPNRSPVTFLDARYSQENAQATSWPGAVAQLEKAGLFWVSSVRCRVAVPGGPDGHDGQRTCNAPKRGP
jgi:hypothetical protein